MVAFSTSFSIRTTQPNGSETHELSDQSYKRCVWIELILLKLKTENWKHYSKIIFKYVNSDVGPIFNEKIDKKNEICGPVNSAYVHCSLQKVNICGYCLLNSNRNTPKRVKKKKKKKK